MIRLTNKHAFFYTEWLSNFYKTGFSWIAFGERNYFTTTEQAFMWAKAKYFGDQDTAAEILGTYEPLKCKQLGRLVKNYNDKQWSLVRYSFMHDVNYAKYTQDKELQAKLLDKQFDGKTFVEASPTDCVWGIGFGQVDAPDDESLWLGQNLLGKVLTQVRAELLAGKQFTSTASAEFAYEYDRFGNLHVDRKCLAGARCESIEVLCSAWNANLKDNDIAKLAAESEDYVDSLELKMNVFVDNCCISLSWHLFGLDVDYNAYKAFIEHVSFRAINDAVEAATEWFAQHNLEEISEKFYAEAEIGVAKAIVERLKLN